MKGLYYYKLVSPYPEDTTKNCKLTINEIDSNFLTLKDEDIKSAELVREDKTLVLTRQDGDKLIVDLNDVVFDLSVKADTLSESGATIVISFDGPNGKEQVTINNLVTVDNLHSIIGSDILTRVINDGSLKGDGTMTSPLGIAAVEKTGMLAPALEKIDLTNGERLPEVAALGTRYVTVEYVDDYGYLYNGDGIEAIKSFLNDNNSPWRIPTKEDWDALFDSMEPSCYQNHTMSKCHVELGKYAGAYLKSACGWLCQPECDCMGTAPDTGCTVSCTPSGSTDYVEGDEDMGIPQYDPTSPSGVDKYGMRILPCGSAALDAFDKPVADGFKAYAYYWTDSFVYNDVAQNRYVKKFAYNKGGIWQESECPSVYYSIRLVKDYDGQNYFDTEYIGNKAYKTLLFPESKQIWLALNFAADEELKCESAVPCRTLVNDGEINNKRKVLFINEWNGEYWEKRMLEEGDTIVIENPIFDNSGDKEIEVCWKNESGGTETITVVIPAEVQNNVEYRVYSDDECSQDLVNTDDLVIERVLKIVVPIIMKGQHDLQGQIDEINSDIDAISADVQSKYDELKGSISQEKEERVRGDRVLYSYLVSEVSARTQADIEINERIDAEISARTQADTELQENIDKEIARAIGEEARIEAKVDALSGEVGSNYDELNAKIEAETERAIEAEALLQTNIDKEVSARTQADEALDAKIEAETERATAREDEIEGKLIDTSKNPFTFKAAVAEGDKNLEMGSVDGKAENSVQIIFDGDFGMI